MFNAIDPALMKEFKITAAQLGQLSAFYFYGDVLLLLPAGVILDRFSTRRIIITAMIISIISTIVFSQASNLAIAKLCRFMTGTAAAFCFLSCIRLASRWFPPKRLALVVGIVVTMACMGGTVAQTPMTLLTDYLGWREALLIDAGVGLLLLAIIFLFVRDYPAGTDLLRIHKKHLEEVGFFKSLWLALRNLQNWLAGLYTSLLNLPIFLLGAMWGSLYLVQMHGLTRTQASYVTSMIFIGTIFGSPIIGWCSDRIGKRKLPMILGAILSLAVIVVIMALDQITITHGMILFFLLGFFTSAQIISYPLIAESNPRYLTGTASGLASTLIMAGGVIQPIFGWLMGLHWNKQFVEGVPFYSAHDYLFAMSIMPIGFIVGLIISFLAKETHCRYLHENQK